MNKIELCYERIRVIRGVNYGLISNEQIQIVFDIFQPDTEQKQRIMELLEKEGIRPGKEDELPKRIFNERAEPKNTDRFETGSDGIAVSAEQTCVVRHRADRAKTLRICFQEIKNNPQLVQQYQDESIVLKRAIIEQKDCHNKSVFRHITMAAMQLSSYRSREIRKNGWVCGTYLSRVKECFERWLQYLFTGDELLELVSCCENGAELNPQLQEVLLLVLHYTPNILIHRYTFDKH